jgi:uncharacterized membrane protein
MTILRRERSEDRRTLGRSIRLVGTYGLGIVLRILLILILLEMMCAIDMIACASADSSSSKAYTISQAKSRHKEVSEDEQKARTYQGNISSDN